MPGGSDPTVGIHNLAYPICYMRAYINKSSKSIHQSTLPTTSDSPGTK